MHRSWNSLLYSVFPERLSKTLIQSNELITNSKPQLSLSVALSLNWLKVSLMDRFVFICISVLALLSGVVDPASFHLTNRCRHTIWPGLLSGANTAQLSTTGFTLDPGESRSVPLPHGWSGRVWARTHCSTSGGKFTCLTGDCGSGKLECAGAGAIPPATLAEFTLNGAGGLDFYDVSLVDGYNLPLLVVARGGGPGGDCSPTGCLVDLNGACPAQLSVSAAMAKEALSGGAAAGGNVTRRVGAAVACKSACEAFGSPEYCCSEAYNTPDTCRPSVFSLLFKHACPRAYSYAYDDKTSTFTCASAKQYLIIFCPPPYTSERLLGSIKMAGELPLVNKSMMHLHSSDGVLSLGPAKLQLVGVAILAQILWNLDHYRSQL